MVQISLKEKLDSWLAWLQVDGETNKDAAWYYPEPKAGANNIKGYVAFWKGVKVV